jgi:hypothetical protein
MSGRSFKSAGHKKWARKIKNRKEPHLRKVPKPNTFLGPQICRFAI